MSDELSKNFNCSFCNRSSENTYKMISGINSYICKNCAYACVLIFEEDEDKDDIKTSDSLLKPKEVKALLDESIIGQDQAKISISVAVYNHYKRVFNKKTSVNFDIEIDKSNILLIGPTGTGKTLFAKCLAKILDVPFAIADATSLTQAGYVGEDVESILSQLIINADNSIERAEIGIIYIDEIDKIAKTTHSDNPSITRDVSGEGVQQALLQIIGGKKANVPPQGGKKHPQQEFLKIDTSKILFICGGAFVGLDKIIEERQGKSFIGFRNSDENSTNKVMNYIIPEDLKKFGMIPEFIGRFPIISELNDLTKEDLVKILIEPKNALIKQYQELFNMDDRTLSFTNGAIDLIAQNALERKVGARGLKSIMETILMSYMYNLDEDNIIKITEDIVKNKLEIAVI